MTDKEWDQIQDVHLKGAFSCTHAAWPIFRKQKFGRVVNTASAAGLFGESLVFKSCSGIFRIHARISRELRTG